MANPPFLKLISKEEKNSEKAIKAFVDAVRKYEKGLASELFAIMREDIATGSNRSIRKTVGNVKKINSFQAKVRALLLSGAYNTQVNTFLKSIKENSTILNSYFSAVSSGFEKKALFDQIIKVNTEAVRDNLQRSGVNQRFTSRISGIVNNAIRTGAELKDVKRAFASVVVDDSILSKYSGQVGTDSLNQFSREYIDTVAGDLGLVHYFFKGTPLKDSRSFCLCRKGKYYIEAEVLKWGSPNYTGCGTSKAGEWNGRIAVTNQDNIKTNLGGWGCVDRLVPVSEIVYDRNK